MSSSQEKPDEAPPALPPRSTQRDSRGSPQASPSQPTHPVPAESSAKAPAPPPVPDKTAAPQLSQPTQPTLAQQVQGLFPTAAPSETIKTKREELTEGDAHWQWKVGFRVAAIIVGLIGIGCAAWIVANFTNSSSDMYYYFNFYDAWTLPWTLITFTVSVLWSAVCIVVFFAQRSNAPVHPGAQVGVDLILWLGLLTTGLLAIFGTVSVAQWGDDGTLGGSGSGSGHYSMSTNGTWVWKSNQYSSYYGEDRGCNSTSSSRSSYSMFSSCEEQDAYVNALWQGKNMRYNMDLTATVCQCLSLLFHFILFIWACVDTHHRNTRSVSKDAEKLAANIVMNMVKNGAVIPAPGQAHFQPMPMAQQGAPMGFVYPQQPYPQQHSQPYPQQYPQQHFQPYPQQYPGQYPTSVAKGKAPVQQTAVTSSSDEKGAGPRYA